MDIDNLRAVRATLLISGEELEGEEGLTGLTAMRDIRYAISELDALLPIVTDAEALAALCA